MAFDAARRRGSVLTGGCVVRGSRAERRGVLGKRSREECSKHSKWFAFREPLSEYTPIVPGLARDVVFRPQTLGGIPRDRSGSLVPQEELRGVMNPIDLFGVYGQDRGTAEDLAQRGRELPVDDSADPIVLRPDEVEALQHLSVSHTSRGTVDPDEQEPNHQLANRIENTFVNYARRGTNIENLMHAAKLQEMHRSNMQKHPDLFRPADPEQLAKFDRFSDPPRAAGLTDAGEGSIPHTPYGDRPIVKRRRVLVDPTPTVAPAVEDVTELHGSVAGGLIMLPSITPAAAALEFSRTQKAGFIEFDDGAGRPGSESAIQQLVAQVGAKAPAKRGVSDMLSAMRMSVTITDEDEEVDGVPKSPPVPRTPAHPEQLPTPRPAGAKAGKAKGPAAAKPTSKTRNEKKAPKIKLQSWNAKFDTDPDISLNIAMDLFERSKRDEEALYHSTFLRALSHSDSTGFVPQNIDATQKNEEVVKLTRAFIEYLMHEPFPGESLCKNAKERRCKALLILLPQPTFPLVSLASALQTYGPSLSPRVAAALSDNVCWLCKLFDVCIGATTALTNNKGNKPGNLSIAPFQVLVDQDGEFHPLDCILMRSTRYDGIKGPIIRFSLTGYSEVVMMRDGHSRRALTHNARKPSKSCELNFLTGSRGHIPCLPRV